ncbi:MAG: FtsX-like permease family protein [Cyclobacteriaceae bacterium]|nr:FtsX-like permease family protein [Cyclobacteriaceae bacterium]
MNLSSFIARRYFFSGKKKNFIHILTIISVIIVAVCCASLVVVLSVFNGLEGLLRSLNTAFDPEIKVSLVRGKSFEYDENFQNKLKTVEGVGLITEVIEDYAYIKYKEAEMVVTMKGVSEDLLKEGRIDNSIVAGKLRFTEDELQYAIMGRGIANSLSVNMRDEMTAIQFHYIKDMRSGSIDPSKIYSRKAIMPGAIFSIQKYFDENYIFVPLGFAKELMGYNNKRTSLEIKPLPGYSSEKLKENLIEQLGETFNVLNNEEQHADLYKLLKVEKLFVFIALVVIMGVGSINILFVLSMLAIDKKADIAILYSMGATKNMVRKIFLKEGMIIAVTGTSIGLFIGWAICALQQSFGLVSMGMETAVQSEYPVSMEVMDFVYTALCILIIAFTVSFRPAIIASHYSSLENLPA